MRSVGPHRVTNLNVVENGVDQLFNDGRKASILYSDPPWGEGNTKYWATMARKSGQDVMTVSYDALMNSIFYLIEKHVSNHVLIETGLRFEDDVRKRMEGVGLKNVTRVQLSYGGGIPNVLIHGAFKGPGLLLTHLEGMGGAKVAELAIDPIATPGQILFDPCCGMGYSARAALIHGMEFRGNELNTKRLEKTIARLENDVSHCVAS